MSEDPTERASFSRLDDDPLDAADARPDLFDRHSFVQAVAGVMRRAHRPGGSSVFGLIGSWGSGKTSVISMLTRELLASDSGQPSWRIATFNPWGYGDQVSLQWGFFAELRAAVPSGKAWKDVKKTVDTVRRFATPAASIAGMAVAGSKDLTDAALGLFETSPTKARRAAEIALGSLEQPILVVIDDLDRLSSTELLEVFKLVRFTGRLPNVYYLLSYDEQTLLALLAKTDLVGDAGDGRALDYLEKIVQVRFDVPPLLPELVQREFDDGLTALLADLGVHVSDEDSARLTRAFAQALRHRLDTPRAIRRYLAQVDAFLPPVADEVDWVDFVLLSWIRTFEPVLYGLIQPRRDLLLGNRGFSGATRAAKEAESKSAVQAMLDASGLDPIFGSQTRWLLGTLFPAVRNATVAGQSAEQSSERGRINNADYFDRFFQFGVPVGDISDAMTREALRTISSGKSAQAVLLLESQLAHSTDRTIRKLRFMSVRAGIDDEAVARWIATRYVSIDRDDGTFFNPQTSVENYFAELLLAVEVQRAMAVVEEATVDVPTATLVASAVAVLSRKQFGGQEEIATAHELGWTLTAIAATRAREHVESGVGDALTVFDVPADVWRLIWRWDDLTPDEVQAFFKSRVGDDRWAALDVLGRFVGSSRPLGVPNPIVKLSGLNVEFAQRLLDLDDLTAKLGPTLDGAGSVPADRALLDTAENRRMYALAWLRARRDGNDRQ